jgi:hypothetical protein
MKLLPAVLILITVATLMMNGYQASVIAQQRALITKMAQDPDCMAAPTYAPVPEPPQRPQVTI